MVYDPGGSPILSNKKARSRQVQDLPRISVAEPLSGRICFSPGISFAASNLFATLSLKAHGNESDENLSCLR
jgi:hypothetical protein